MEPGSLQELLFLRDMWAMGIVFSMIMFWRADRASTHQKYRWGFTYSLFLSTLFGLVIGWAYLTYKVIEGIETLWNSSSENLTTE